MKKVFIAFLMIFAGILIQNKYEVIQQIVDLEDRLFHREEYDFVLRLLPLSPTTNIMGVQSKIINSYGEYVAELLIPVEYHVSNRPPLKGTVARNGYYTYALSRFRKGYRDLCGYDGLIIAPESPDLPRQPIIIALLLNNDIRHLFEDYTIETIGKKVILTRLDGKRSEVEKNRCARAFF